MSHPVKLVVTDDLQRTRVSVFFRLLLAIPLFLWLYLWGIAVFAMTIANWLATLTSGTPLQVAHDFASRYVRFAVHVHAYVALLADPYPGFSGDSAYPVDVELPGPERQNRWKVAFRLVLALPALLLASVLTTGLWANRSDAIGSYTRFGGLLTAVAVLGWFAALARARMPRGLRDAGAYGVLYGAQAWAYVLLLTDRYPDSDPQAALAELPADEHPLRLDVADDRRRGRAGTFFRLLLAIPHVAWLAIWGIAVYVAVILSWFVQVVAGRPSAGLHRFISTWLRYATQVYAYIYLVADPYPEFEGRTGAYPVELTTNAPERQDRLTVAFRLVLAVPALVLSTAYGGVAGVAVVLGWFAVLVRGEMPRGLRNAIALYVRYYMQTAGYLMLLTARYPHSGPTAAGSAEPPATPVFLPPDALATT